MESDYKPSDQQVEMKAFLKKRPNPSVTIKTQCCRVYESFRCFYSDYCDYLHSGVRFRFMSMIYNHYNHMINLMSGDEH